MLEEEGARVLGVSRSAGIDVTALDATADRIVAALGGTAPDILVNNAGTSFNKTLDEADRGRLERPVAAQRHGLDAADARLRARDGRARVGPDRQRHLVVGEAAVGHQRRLLGRQGRAARCRVFLRTPTRRAACLVNGRASPTASPLWMDEGAASRTGRLLARGHARGGDRGAGGRIPRGRFGTPEEIASVVVFLCSERAANVAGAAWSVDGGTVATIV